MDPTTNQPVTTDHDQDYALTKVPESARKGFWPMFFIMLGFTFFSASMSVGAKMANGLNFSQFLTAVIVGGIILGAYTGVLGYIGSQTGLSLDLLPAAPLGCLAPISRPPSSASPRSAGSVSVLRCLRSRQLSFWGSVPGS